MGNLIGQFWPFLAAAGALVVAFIAAMFKARKDGRNEVEVRNARADAEANEKMARIDRERPDFDGAVSRLRDRASKGKR